MLINDILVMCLTDNRTNLNKVEFKIEPCPYDVLQSKKSDQSWILTS